MTFSDEDYAELLGLYLGDGHIVDHPRTERLRIFMDSKYAVLNGHVRELLVRCFPGHQVGCASAHEGHMTIFSVYARHLSCLLPQHGPGTKHSRPIVLEDWQQRLVRRAPFALLRGLITSDGCHFVNRTGPYEYFCYQFANHSSDILDIFCAACEQVEIEYARTRTYVRINRRESVARMLEYVGVKA